MKYADDDILQLYREAKDKTKEIKILAELNACKTKDIRDFLKSHGVEVPADRRYKDANKAADKDCEVADDDLTIKVAAESPKATKQRLDIPEAIIAILRERRAELKIKIQKLEAEVEEIDKFLGP